MKKDAPYVMVYKNGFVDIAQQLNKSELRVFSYIFNNADFGNICYSWQKDISDNTDLNPPRVSSAVKQITSLNLMKRYRHGFMLNPEYFVLGPMEEKPKLHAMYNKLGNQEIINAEAY